MVLPLNAAAQAYPSKPIRVISPWPPGGPADAIARPIFEKMGETIGQPMVLMNRPGANGEVGTALAAAAEPDGYTVLFASTGPNVISAALQRDLRYNALTSFEPVTNFVNSPSVLVVRANLPVRNLKELIDYAKANPGKLNYASAGTGSAPQISLETFKRAAGLDIKEIPYPGMAPATVDLMGDRVDMMAAQFGSMVPHIQAGKLRAMGMTTARRNSLMPDLPTVAEVVPGFTPTNSWFGLMVPARTPKDIVDKLYAVSVEALKSPALVEQMKKLGLDVVSLTPAQFSEELKRDVTNWTREMKAIGLTK